MNQDNNEFELSGTLGSLNDAALNNLANQNSDETANNNIETNEIEMLEIDVPTQSEKINNNTENISEPVIETHEENYDLNTINTNDALNLNNNLDVPPEINPINNNFEIGDIGSVPPIDPTGKDEKKKKKNHILFIFIVIILILVVGGLVYYYLHISKGTVANAVEPKNITLNLGEELPTDINEYAEFKSFSGSNCILNTKGVDTNKSGTYEFSITCGNNEYKGNITLQDTKAPIVKTKTIVKKLEETVMPEDFIEYCNEPSECLYSFENAESITENLKQVGNYDVNIVVKDVNNNSTIASAKLVVIETEIKAYLSCSLEEQSVEGFNGKVNNIEKIAINPDLKYNGLYFKVNEYIVSNIEEYNNIKNNYVENNILSINNGVGTPTFNDETLSITVEEILSGDIEYGDDYSSIRTYLETNGNYKCKIESVN